MIVVPSIDLEGGVAVKRVKGLRGTGLTLGDPLRILERIASVGLRKVHIVDLEGAARGRITGAALRAASMARELGLEARVGGGLRSAEAIIEACRAGATEAVVGSLWVVSPGEAVEALKSSPCRLVAAVDVSEGRVVYGGWEARSELTLVEALRRVREIGFGAALVTDVDREGTVSGVDRCLASTARGAFNGRLYYAGGVSSPEDLEFLESIGVDEVIVGMAFYTGRLPLEVILSYA